MYNFNLHEEKLNASNQNERPPLKGKGFFIFWNASLFLHHLRSDADAGKVIKKALLICQGKTDTVGDFVETIFEEPTMAADVFQQIMAGAIQADTNYEKRSERSKRYQQKKKQEVENAKNQMPSNDRPTSVQQASNKRPQQDHIKQDNTKTKQIERQNNTSQVDRQQKEGFATIQQPVSGCQQISDEELAASARKLAYMSCQPNRTQPVSGSQTVSQPKARPKVDDSDIPKECFE